MQSIFLPLLLIGVGLDLHQAYEINPSLKFSEAIETIPIGRHFENLTIYHPFYLRLANGTLPLDQFKAFTQQDDLYVRNIFAVFRTLAGRETDPGRKQWLTKIGSDNWEPYFQTYYDKFNFTAPKYMVPVTIEYTTHQMFGAKHWDLGAAAATLVPCFTIWSKMGKIIQEIADLPNNPNHPYKEFIEANAGSPSSSQQQKEFLELVDGYYERLGPENTKLRQQMFDAYLKSVEHEYLFAESNLVLQPESVPPPQFSDLVKYINDDMQQDVIQHRLYDSMANGNLPLDSFKVLVQQSHMYFKSFYKAFELMEQKETDPELKKHLRKDGEYMDTVFIGFYEEYNFKAAETAESYTSDYGGHIKSVAKYQTVAEGLAAVFPSYFLWNQMGTHMNKLADLRNNPEHPYHSFVLFQDGTNSISFPRFNSLINRYFERIDPMDVEMQNRMYQAVHKSVVHEYLFATEVYERSLMSTNF